MTELVITNWEIQMKLLLIVLFISVTNAILNTGMQLRIEELFDTAGHTNNWAVLVGTSRYEFFFS